MSVYKPLCIAAAAILLQAGPAVGADMRARPADRTEAVFYNGRVYTLEEGAPVAEAVSVGGGRILAVGSSEAVLASAGPQAARYDLRGLAVIPGLVDAHAHFGGYAEGLARLDLVPAGSMPEIAGIVGAEAARLGPGEWITGRGWDQNDWPSPVFPKREDIDPVSRANPVLLVRVCGHAALANTAALEAAGIDPGTPDPPGGRIERNAEGDPTGILIDEAISLVREAVPALPRSRKKELLAEAAGRCLAAGLTGVHEMGVRSETARLYMEMYREEELPLRITAYYEGDADDIDSLLSAGPVRGFAGDMFSIIGVKLYADGSLGARSAALLEDYSDDPGNRGILVTDPDTLKARIARAHGHGFGTAVHAIGDRANRIVLDILEEVRGDMPARGFTDRIEHAQVIAPRDIPRFAAAGVIPSMQFVHCTSDMPWAEERLGAGRLSGAYAWRDLMDSGCRIPGGSDFPVESIDPLRGIYAAVTRMDGEGEPRGGWYPSQRLTVEEAVRAFTLDAARAACQDEDRGSISPGKLADLVVLSGDIFVVPVRAMRETGVVATVLGGEIVYRSGDAPF